MSFSAKEQIELLRLIESEKKAYRDKVNYNGGSYEGALELLYIINDPASPLWKIKICREVLEEPSPLMEFIARLGMGRDHVEALTVMEQYSV